VAVETSTAIPAVVRAKSKAGRSPTRPRATLPKPGDSDEPTTKLSYVPALDGIRAVALAAVMCYHHGIGAARGGFLGVSTFFTLSGFLITTLALGEWAGSGRLSPARFWERRARRLLPAALVTIVGIAVLRAVTDIGANSSVRGDLLAALGYVANWRFAATGNSYGALFTEPSPVLHFWSLAIEEQFYVLFPVTFLLVMAVAGRVRTWAAGLVFAALGAGSFALAYLTYRADGNNNAAYYGTHTRAGELLVGVTLAFLWRSPTVQRATKATVGRAAAWVVGPLAIGGLLLLWHTTEFDAPRLFKGATAANAALSAVLIVVALMAGPVARVLGLWPLRSVGKISYAAYLYHWPVFLVLAEPRVHLDYRPLFVARVVVTFALATVSYHLFEAPFRFRLRMPRIRLAGGLVTAGAVVAAAVVLVPAQKPKGIDFTDMITGTKRDENGEILPQFPFLRKHGLVRPSGGQEPVARILLAGDSLSASMRTGFEDWNDHHPDQQIWLDTYSVFGCPMVDTGIVPLATEYPTFPGCKDWHRKLDEYVAKWDDDVIFFVMGLSDLRGHKIAGPDSPLVDLGTPAHDQWFSAQIGKLARTLRKPGHPVVWSNFPHVRFDMYQDPTKTWQDYTVNEPWRVDRFNEVLRTTLAGRPGITYVDMDSWIRSWPSGEWDPELRDGVHFQEKGSELAGEWLIPQLLAVARR